MKKNRYLALFLVTMMMFSVVSSACATTATTTLGYHDWLDSGVSVIVVGDYEFTSQFATSAECSSSLETKNFNTTVDLSNIITHVDSLSTLPNKCAESPDNVAALVISKNVVSEYTSDGDKKDALESLLNAGNVAYFPETTYKGMSDIFEAIADDSFNMVPVDEDNADNVTAYVFKDSDGNYYTGNIIASSTTSQEIIDERILVETLESRNVYATGRSSSDFKPGYKWNQLTGWHKNSYAGKNTGVTWLSEWICFYSTQTQEGDRYYAWAGEWCMEPYDEESSLLQWASEYVKYESSCSSQQTGIQLRDYWPKNEPTSSTGSISLRIGSGEEYNFGFDYEWSLDDLSFTDNSKPSQEYCKLQWNFSHFGLNPYDSELAYGKFAMIFKDTKKSSSYTFHHYRDAQMYAVSTVLRENAGANYKSTYTFKP